jgi:hypothetical protein
LSYERTGLLAWPSTSGRCYEHWPDVPAHFFRLGGSGDAFRHSPTASPSRLSKTRHFCRAWDTIFRKIFRPHDLGSGSRHAALPSRIIRIAEPPPSDKVTSTACQQTCPLAILRHQKILSVASRVRAIVTVRCMRKWPNSWQAVKRSRPLPPKRLRTRLHAARDLLFRQ